MDITFWGVRGSIASPGTTTTRVGGNTSCVEVCTAEQRFVLDAGTGIRTLGEALMARGGPVDVVLCLSHLHWDHIQGLPFFVPSYLPSTRIHVLGPAFSDASVRDTLARQMASPVFPVRFNDLASRTTVREVMDRDDFTIGSATLRTARLHHPGGCIAWRIDAEGASIVYATDTEHDACVDPALASFARTADVLVYDSQYTPEEYRGASGPPRVGWGHSTYAAGAELAAAACVAKLVLFHHDPQRTDDQVDEIERRAREIFPCTTAAREGLRISLRRLAHAA